VAYRSVGDDVSGHVGCLAITGTSGARMMAASVRSGTQVLDAPAIGEQPRAIAMSQPSNRRRTGGLGGRFP